MLNNISFKKKIKTSVKYLKIIIILGILILLSISIFIFYKKNKIINTTVNSNIFLPRTIPTVSIFESKKIIENNKKNDKSADLKILEIPKIKLKKILPDVDSPDNNVDKNIYVIKESIFPDNINTNNSHVILAAHSGYGNVAFFKNLTKLIQNDLIYLHCANKKYIYKITKIKIIEKNGQIIFSKEYDNDITLITCLKNSNEQIIYQGILISTSNI